MAETTETIIETTSQLSIEPILPPQNTDGGYQYPVPENPLIPSKKVVIETIEPELPLCPEEDPVDIRTEEIVRRFF